MKRAMAFLLTFVFLLGFLPERAEAAGASWTNNNVLVAHALGEANGKIETNSREAFLNSWESGFRVMEADFVYTSDNVLVVRHDFEPGGSYYRLEIPAVQPYTMDSVRYKNTKIAGNQTPLTAADLLQLMAEYPDVYIVTDTKNTDEATVKRQFRDLKNLAQSMGIPQVLDRIVPQIYSYNMYFWVKSQYPFQEWIFTLYQMQNPNYNNVIDFCLKNGVGTVTIAQSRANWNTVQTFKRSGLKLYVHTINRHMQLQELLQMGVDGVYTDRIKPYELSWVGRQNPRQLKNVTADINGKSVNLMGLDIFGTSYVPLRALEPIGKGFSAEYDRENKVLALKKGGTFKSLGNEVLMDNSGRLITKKADFKLTVDGKDTGITCFLTDGEIYVPYEQMRTILAAK